MCSAYVIHFAVFTSCHPENCTLLFNSESITVLVSSVIMFNVGNVMLSYNFSFNIFSLPLFVQGSESSVMDLQGITMC